MKKSLPLSMLAALGLTTETACACLDMGVCLKVSSPDSGDTGDTTTGPCLDYPSDDTGTTGPCLDYLPDSGDTGDTGDTGRDTGKDTGRDTGDTGRDTGKDTGDGGDTAVVCLDAPVVAAPAAGPTPRRAFPGYAEAVDAVLSRGILPADVAARLRDRR